MIGESYWFIEMDESQCGMNEIQSAGLPCRFGAGGVTEDWHAWNWSIQ